MSDNKPLRRGVSGVCTRSICECERDGLGDQCVWLKPAEAEFECLGEPSLCENPRGCVPCRKTPNAQVTGAVRRPVDLAVMGPVPKREER